MSWPGPIWSALVVCGSVGGQSVSQLHRPQHCDAGALVASVSRARKQSPHNRSVASIHRSAECRVVAALIASVGQSLESSQVSTRLHKASAQSGTDLLPHPLARSLGLVAVVCTSLLVTASIEQHFTAPQHCGSLSSFRIHHPSSASPLIVQWIFSPQPKLSPLLFPPFCAIASFCVSPSVCVSPVPHLAQCIATLARFTGIQASLSYRR